ncbi:hypothetical protein MIT9_P0954 [Methylomarinovum caldicuralii]|uniref:Formate dehydrogenase region TAT target n=1 Tax=Methylomarinovum caldicuralii TaxID=438856 RepID=A0AAU9CIE6_9GAMM|nr:hypothetical protein [Methylomarinovum caldicuralii]BCX81376.1 hypothetical protein MIT9_P0954 [Methylomarinovum caldicuralii]
MKRRRFLQTLLGAGGVAATAAALGQRREQAVAETDAEKPSGYRETDHVRRYYQTAREA